MRLSPRNSKPHWARLVAAVAGTSLGVGALSGCSSFSANPLDTKSFIDPSELAGRVRKDTLVVKILNQVDPAIEEPNREFVTAQPPTQDDLIVNATDYAISKNDLLSVEISDLSGPGTQTVKTTRVSESGNISLPYVGQIKAEGLTEYELEQRIIEAYRAARIIERAQVSVSVAEAQGRAFSVLGEVGAPGQYALINPDFRVLDALTLARGTTSPLIEDIYILRRTDLNRARTGGAGGAGNSGRMAPTDGGAMPAGPAPATAPRPGGGVEDIRPPQSMVPNPTGRQGVAMVNPVAPAAKARPLLLADAAPQYAQAPGTTDERGRFILVDGKKVYIDQPATGATAAPAEPAAPADPVAPSVPAPINPAPVEPVTPPASAAPTPNATVAEPPAAPAPPVVPATPNPPPAIGPDATATTPGGNFAGFRDLAAPDNVRIIRIPLQRLRNGELQYNVVIKPRDMIVVQNLPVGTYYMGGHVGRPSAYSISPTGITLKQAVISAGMLDQLAIPERTDIIRRLGKDREVFVRVNLAKIFEGDAPDIYLKPDDQVLVGTNMLAPFIAAVRGAFRFTYGFGFLYDRNFASEENQNFND